MQHVEPGLCHQRDFERVRERDLAAFGEVRGVEDRLNGIHDGGDRGTSSVRQGDPRHGLQLRHKG